MKTTILIIVFIIVNVISFAQVNELENFRKELTFYINHDRGKTDSIPKTASNILKLKKNAEGAFKKFILKRRAKI